jgi:hypothetical protein
MAVPQLFVVCNSAIDLVVRNIAELWRCGLKLRMPTFAIRKYCTVDVAENVSKKLPKSLFPYVHAEKIYYYHQLLSILTIPHRKLVVALL